MNIKEVTSWKTSDGSVFEDKEKAIWHEATQIGMAYGWNKIIRALHDWGQQSGGGTGMTDTMYHQVADTLIKSKEHFYK